MFIHSCSSSFFIGSRKNWKHSNGHLNFESGGAQLWTKNNHIWRHVSFIYHISLSVSLDSFIPLNRSKKQNFRDFQLFLPPPHRVTSLKYLRTLPSLVAKKSQIQNWKTFFLSKFTRIRHLIKSQLVELRSVSCPKPAEKQTRAIKVREIIE